MPEQAQTQPIIILCDGTWCGREADTKSNIYLLAKMMGVPIDDPTDTDVHVIPGKAWYIHGVGLGSTFLDYVFNGVTGQDIASQCVAAYRFIVDNYTYPEHQIWMFGLSRGSYIVRMVAGMINNCGIIKHVRNSDGTLNTVGTDLLCWQVYKIYRSYDPINKPHAAQSKAFRQNASWPLIGDEPTGTPSHLPPVKFMGILDTVGSLGIPDFVGGVGLDWPKFHDRNVSNVVENVYHALSLHDRFYIFPPCLASRKPRTGRPRNFGITQQWFPGVHYDLGRQKFRFLRPLGGGWLERLLSRSRWVSKEIQPNEVLADVALKWMVEAIRIHDTQGDVIALQRGREEIDGANERIVSDDRRIGDGDVYENILAYAPFGSVLLQVLTAILGTRWQMNQLYQLFFALRDRVIQDYQSRVYDYDRIDPSIPNAQGQSIATLAGVTEARYPSEAHKAWELSRRVSRIS